MLCTNGFWLLNSLNRSNTNNSKKLFWPSHLRFKILTCMMDSWSRRPRKRKNLFYRSQKLWFIFEERNFWLTLLLTCIVLTHKCKWILTLERKPWQQQQQQHQRAPQEYHRCWGCFLLLIFYRVFSLKITKNEMEWNMSNTLSVNSK